MKSTELCTSSIARNYQSFFSDRLGGDDSSTNSGNWTSSSGNQSKLVRFVHNNRSRNYPQLLHSQVELYTGTISLLGGDKNSVVGDNSEAGEKGG